MEQNNKVYEHPEMEVIMLETKPLLAGSDNIDNVGGEDGDASLFYD